MTTGSDAIWNIEPKRLEEMNMAVNGADEGVQRDGDGETYQSQGSKDCRRAVALVRRASEGFVTVRQSTFVFLGWRDLYNI